MLGLSLIQGVQSSIRVLPFSLFLSLYIPLLPSPHRAHTLSFSLYLSSLSRYGCVGYSVYSDRKGQKDVQDGNPELPACIGIEVLVDRKVTGADSVPAHAHNRQDNRRSPQPQTQKSAPQTQKPAVSLGDEFLKRFTRNAGLVAAGVAKNVKRVGNYVKASVDDILYPYRRPPKMATMWETKRIHHETQSKIGQALNARDISQSSKETSEHHHKVTVQLWVVVQEWGID